MPRVIVYGRPDGGVDRISPNPAALAALTGKGTALPDGTTEEAEAAKLAAHLKRAGHSISAAVEISLRWVSAWRGGGLTEDAALALMAAVHAPPGAIGLTIVGAADLPPDETFRNAWVLSAGRVVVDMAKARALHMARIRAARDAALPALDAAFTRAIGRKDAATADAVEAKREALRQIPQTFDLLRAATPEELKALWPKGLELPGGGA